MKLTALVTAACLAAGGLVAVAPGGSAAVEPTARTVKAVDWGRCGDPTLRQLGGKCGFVDGAAGLLAPARQEDPARRVAGEAHRQGLEVPGRDAASTPVARGIRARAVGPRPGHRRVRAATASATPTTGSASTRAASAPASRRCRCDPDYFGPNRPDYVPSTPELEQAWLDRSPGYARGLRQAGGAAARPHDDHRRGSRHGRDPQGARRPSRSTTTGSRTAPTSPRSTPRCSRQRMRRMVLDSNVDPRTGLVPRQPRPGHRLRPQPRVCSSPGSHATTACTTSVRPGPQVRAALHRRPRAAGRHPDRRRRSDPTSGTTSSCTPATRSSSGRTSPTCSPTGSPRATATRSSTAYQELRRTRSTTTPTRCTPRCPASTTPGRTRTSSPTSGAPMPRPRSSPGATPGSTGRATPGRRAGESAPR